MSTQAFALSINARGFFFYVLMTNAREFTSR